MTNFNDLVIWMSHLGHLSHLKVIYTWNDQVTCHHWCGRGVKCCVMTDSFSLLLVWTDNLCQNKESLNLNKNIFISFCKNNNGDYDDDDDGKWCLHDIFTSLQYFIQPKKMIIFVQTKLIFRRRFNKIGNHVLFWFLKL